MDIRGDKEGTLYADLSPRTCTSSIYTITYEQLIREFHTTREIATLGLTSFVLGLAMGPMFLAPMSEVHLPIMISHDLGTST